MLDLRGDRLIYELGGLYPALCALQGDKFRQMNDQLDFATRHQDLFPKQYMIKGETLTHGASAQYSGGAPLEPRHRRFPYQPSSEEHCVSIAEKLRKDVAAHRMLVCTTETADASMPMEATPTTTAE